MISATGKLGRSLVPVRRKGIASTNLDRYARPKTVARSAIRTVKHAKTPPRVRSDRWTAFLTTEALRTRRVSVDKDSRDKDQTAFPRICH